MTAWQKLNEYYTKLGDSPLFAASIILHPSLGMNYLEVNWALEEQLVWVRDAKIGLSDYLDRWYHCNRPVDEQQKMIMDTSTSLSVPRTTTEVSVFKQWIKSRTAKTTVMGSELERYLRLEPQETEDPIEWWMAHQGQFPMISQLALDILAIPAMATDCERSFSLAKLTLTTQRLSMTTETLEKLQCLKNWVRHVLRVIKYLKYDLGFDLFDLRAALNNVSLMRTMLRAMLHETSTQLMDEQKKMLERLWDALMGNQRMTTQMMGEQLEMVRQLQQEVQAVKTQAVEESRNVDELRRLHEQSTRQLRVMREQTSEQIRTTREQTTEQLKIIREQTARNFEQMRLQVMKEVGIVQGQAAEEIRQAKEELKQAREEMQQAKEEISQMKEQLKTIAGSISSGAQTSPQPSYADVARTPPTSQPSNVRTLSSMRTTPSSFTDTLFCTIDQGSNPRHSTTHL
uniref:HAT C-terminal dimerisation domain-containing protein n=2 Tax=Fusarium oxysporum TaxID=5507 RepID=A0A0D2XRW9_FUSOF